MTVPVSIVTRAQWKAREPSKPSSPSDLGHMRGLAVHHSGSIHDREDKHDHCAKRVQGIQDFHQLHKGWSDVAYHWLLCWHGSLYLGRSLQRRSASQGSLYGNERYLAVCVLGDWSDEELPYTVTNGLLEARRRLLTVAAGARKVMPHSVFVPTACPGASLTSWASAHTEV